MRRFVPLIALLVALLVAGATAWLLLHGEPGPVPVDPPAGRPVKVRKSPPKDGRPVFSPIPTEGPDPVEPAAKGEPEEAPLPPDAYPWEVPGWWRDIDRRMREKEIAVDDEVMTVKEILARLEKETLFPVRAGPELEAWAEEHRFSIPVARAPARAVLEAIAGRTNLEVVLTADAILLRQRGRVKEDRVTRAGRVQAALMESRERRDGKRETDPAAAEYAATPVDLAIEGVPLRAAIRVIGERLAVPVYTDEALWAANPEVRVEAGTRPLSKYLDALVAPFGGAWDVTPRRIVLFRP